jgi:uncharacterized protein YqeY
MNLKQQIEGDIKKAMLAKDKDTLRALRGIKSMILLAETEKGSGGELTEDVEIKLLTKAAKQRKESLEVYEQQGRDDLAATEASELEVINRYLPQQLSQADLESKLKTIIAGVGATGPQDMGKVMGKASQEIAGKADGKTIAETVKKLLSNG